MTLTYPIASTAAHPARLSPGYRSTVKRSPSKPQLSRMNSQDITPHTDTMPAAMSMLFSIRSTLATF